MAVTSLEVHKAVYFSNSKNSSLQIKMPKKHFKQYELYLQLVTTIGHLTKTLNLIDSNELDNFEKQMNKYRD